MFKKKDEFIWGVSSSAFQTEGAVSVDGKGPSIWDHFTEKKKRAARKETAVHASQFYARYVDDISLMKEMNIPNFRFSIAWSRIFPAGTGIVNRKGVDFYKRLIDACLENGITPWVTLYHWDLPLLLEYRGGWANRDILDWFNEYVDRCITEFGDKVKNWMVLNEPVVFTGAGYFLGVHAPGRRGLNNFLPAVHHAALCQAAGICMIKERLPDANVGTTFSCSHLQSFSDSEKDIAALKRVDALLNRLFVEPLLGLGYPFQSLPSLRKIEKYFKCGDTDKLKAPFDFIGLQHYTREVVRHSKWTPVINAQLVPAHERKVFRTVMNWEVYPDGMYEIIKKFSAYENVNNIIITENGAAFEDIVTDGEVNDKARLQYLQNYISQVERARAEGYSVKGYFVWSFTDNFEWSEGYHPRFGLVHIDYKTYKRTIKKSGAWYATFLAKQNTFEINMMDHVA